MIAAMTASHGDFRGPRMPVLASLRAGVIDRPWSSVRMIAGALLVGALALAADAAPRGRVVRVERATISAVPRFCSMSGRRGEGTCFGLPQEGEAIEIVDPAARTLRGTFVIESVAEATELASLGLCVS